MNKKQQKQQRQKTQRAVKAAALSMVIQQGVSAKAIGELGPSVRKEPASETRASHGEGAVSVKALRWEGGGWRAMGEGETSGTGGQEKGHH